MAASARSEEPTSRRSRKGEILTTFTELVAERGYDEVSLRDIAETLGMSKGTILHHYGSKDRLLEQVHAQYMRRRLDEAHIILERFSTPPERLTALIYQLLLAQRDDRAATAAFAREIVRFQSDVLMSEVREQRREYFGIVADVIRDGMDEGCFRRDEPALVSFQFFGMCNWMWTWLRPGGRWSIDQIAHTYISTFLSGLATTPEHAAVQERNIGRVVEEVMQKVSERDG